MEVKWQSLLTELLDDGISWNILEELQDKSETELNAILRPSDDADFFSQDPNIVTQRTRLNKVLDALVLFEISCELGLANKLQIPNCKALQTLADFKGAFHRYVTTYYYHGIRILAYRLFGPSWLRPAATDDNRRAFTLAYPPPLPYSEQNERRLDEFLALNDRFIGFTPNAPRPDWWEACCEAREFLGASHIGGGNADPAPASESIRSSKTASYELWLRGLLSLAEDDIYSQRYETIGDGMIAWAKARTKFYRELPQVLPVHETAEDKMSNPLTARLALADMYWIARILRAGVSANGAVSYANRSWLHLLRFRKALDGESPEYRQELVDCEDQLRAIFDYVCDLVQNAVALTNRQQLRHFNKEDVPSDAGKEDACECPMEWRAVFDEELREIDSERSQRAYTEPFFAPHEPLPSNQCNAEEYWSERLITGKQPHNRIGIALSGGGVRSASFSLGVLQGLQEFDQLNQADYISTVSGGGFIGAWLVSNVLRAQQWLGRNSCWDESISHLRSYSSYLAPITGILSTDSWILVVSWIRNTFLIQLTTFTWLLIAFLCSWVARKIFLIPARHEPLVNFTWVPGLSTACIGAGVVALLAGITVVAMLWYNFHKNLVETGKGAPPGYWIRWLAVLPSWFGAFAIASILWSVAVSWPLAFRPTRADYLNSGFWSNYSDFGTNYSFILLHAWPSVLVIVALLFVAVFLLGSQALKPDDSENYTGPGLVLSTLWRCLWIGALCGVVFYLGLCGVLYFFLDKQWSVSDPDKIGTYAFVFGPALTLVAFTLAIVLYIGLSGKSSTEAQREWWTRFGAWLTIYGVIGFALSAAAVFGPIFMIKLFTFSSHHLTALKGSVIAGWVGTVLSGLLAGSSSKTSGTNLSGNKYLLELIARIGGCMFVVGTVLGASWVFYVLVLNITTDIPYGTDYWRVFENAFHPLLPMLLIAAAILICGWLFSWFFEINIFGFSQFYRNRIVRCYLGASRWTPGIRKPQPFTKFDFQDEVDLRKLKGNYRGPFPIFNCTLNLGGSRDLAVRTRHSAAFTLTPLRCGSDRPRIGYAQTGEPHSRRSFAGGVKVGQAVAVSGAAASPNMGYNTSRWLRCF